MGCGASSNTQVSPMINKNNNDDDNMIKMNSINPKQQHGQTSLVPNSIGNSTIQLPNHKNFINNNSSTKISNSRTSNGFTLSSLFFPCVSNNSPSIRGNQHQINEQTNSVAIQTEDDLIGFKSQYSQTDSAIMSNEEIEVLIEELDKHTNKNNEKKNDSPEPKVVEEDSDDELFKSQKTWRNIVKNHKNQLIENQSKVNVAIQATKKKRNNITQTPFGSIDHCFIIPKNDQDHNNDLMSCELCNIIVNSNTNDPKLTRLLSSMDEDDFLGNCDDHNNHNHEPTMEITNDIVNSLRKTFDKYDDKHNDKTDDNQSIKNHENVEENNNTNNKEYSISNTNDKPNVENCLFEILRDIRNRKTLDPLLPSISGTNQPIKKRDVSLQTTNDILTDESPEYAARPPLCYKNEMIPSVLMFREIDNKMSNAPDFRSAQDMAQFVCKYARNDLFKIRALFIWIVRNIRFNFDAIEKNYTTAEILEQREGVSKDYCRLFGDVCRMMNIRVKKIEGFVRDYNYRPGHHFKPGQDPLASWNATFVLGSWRFLDLTLASGFTDASGQFQAKTNEHYFLTDPNLMIWTHFPYSDIEQNYERWQLLDKPLSLDEFNQLPKVSEYFFKYNLSIRSKIKNPLEFRISTEVKIGSHEVMRYKYKLYPSNEPENVSLNYYVFCQLKDDRLVGSFMVQPPLEGRFLLKIYAKPEREMQDREQDLSATLNPIVTMLLECTKARKYIEPFPFNELPWGLTQKFYDYKLRLCNQKGPIIVTWGGRRRLVMEANETMLLTYSLYDSDSMEMDTRGIISRADNGFKTTFTINPPRVGTFKFIIFGMPKPKQKGKWRLPLLATLMIDCKLIKPTQHDEDMVSVSHTSDDKNDKKSKGKK